MVCGISSTMDGVSGVFTVSGMVVLCLGLCNQL